MLVQVVKLSDAVQPLPRQSTQFVHGVSPNFLAVGEKMAEVAAEGSERFTKGAYFLGKVRGRLASCRWHAFALATLVW